MPTGQPNACAEFPVLDDLGNFIAYLPFGTIRPLLSRGDARPVRKGSDVKYVLNKHKSAAARSILADQGTTFIGLNGQVAAYYDELLNALTGKVTATVTTLKKYRADVGFVVWSHNEGFRPNRFNPDNIRQPFIRREHSGLTGNRLAA
jgi:hypothetical protein